MAELTKYEVHGLKFTYDSKGDALYFELSGVDPNRAKFFGEAGEPPPIHSVTQSEPNFETGELMLDLNSHGRVSGIEILDACSFFIEVLGKIAYERSRPKGEQAT